MDHSSSILSTSTNGTTTTEDDDDYDNNGRVKVKQPSCWCLSSLFPKLNIFKYLLVEPVCLLQGVANAMQVVILQNFYIDRVCHVSYKIPSEICANLTTVPNEEKLVESTVASYTMYQQLIESGVAIILSLFVGPWMDRHGEKKIVVLTLIGWLLSCFARITFSLLPNVPPPLILLSSLPIGLTGGFSVFIISTFSFMSNNTSVKSRSFRLAFLGVIWDLGSPVGIMLGDKIFEYGGFLAVFSASAGIYLLSIIYSIAMLKNTTNEMAEFQDSDSGNCCSQLFNFGALRETIETYIRRRSGNQRRCLIVLTIAICLNLVNWTGANNYRYLFTRNKLEWDTDTFSDYATISQLLGILGGNLLIFTTMKIYKLSDFTIGISSCISNLSGLLVWAFASTGWQMYLGSGIQMFGTIITSVARSIISKFIPRDEFGKIFSFVTSIEVSMPFLSSILFSFVYSSTVSIFPGTVFLICAGAVGIIILNFIYVFFALRSMDDLLLGEIN